MFRKLKRSDDITLYPLDMVLAFILPLLLFGCAYYLGIRDTKIPQEITLRYDKFDMRLFRGITEDLQLLKDFDLSKDYRIFLQGHVDPGFFVASMIPSLAKVILYVFFFLRLALASFTMHRFLRRNVPLDRSITILLAVCYSLSSSVLGVASYSCVMDTVIIIPVMFDYLIGFLRDDNSVKKGFEFAITVTLIFYFSGSLNLMTALPFVIFATLFFAMAVGTDLINSLILFLKSMPYILAAVGFSAVTFANTILDSRIPFKLDDTNDISQGRTDIFDLLTRLLNGKGIDMSLASGVGLCMTIFILALLIVFFFRRNIPLRIRVTLFSGVAICFIFFCSKTLFRFGMLIPVKVMDSNSVFSARFAFLSAALIFAAAISIRNIAGLSKTVAAGASLSIIILVVLSNNSKNDVSPGTFSMFFTVICAIVSYFLIINIRKIPGYILAVIVLTGLTVNLAFILPISHFGKPTDDAAVLFDGNSEEDMVMDYPFAQLEFFSRDNDDYYELRHFTGDYTSPPGMLNTVTYAIGIEPFFMPLSRTENVFRGVGERPLIDGESMIEEGKTVIAYKTVRLDYWEQDEPLMLYSNYKGEFDMIIECGDQTIEKKLTGPCMIELDDIPENEFSVKYRIADPTFKYEPHFELYTVNTDALEAFRSEALRAGDTFEVEGEATVLLGRRFGSPISVTVDGEKVETYNLAGKTAFDLSGDGISEVKVSSSNKGITISAGFVLFSIICSIVVILLFNKKEKKA